MKLRNKKTGEIKAFDEVMREAYKWNNYNSLAELNKEWEDYEEPEEFWYIYADKPQRADCGHLLEEEFKAIGNYFETKEEAEKAVEKLKAWKRLKDARFEFGTIKYNLDEESSSTIAYDGIITIKGMAYEDFADDLDMCFGGEE